MLLPKLHYHIKFSELIHPVLRLVITETHPQAKQWAKGNRGKIN